MVRRATIARMLEVRWQGGCADSFFHYEDPVGGSGSGHGSNHACGGRKRFVTKLMDLCMESLTCGPRM